MTIGRIGAIFSDREWEAMREHGIGRCCGLGLRIALSLSLTLGQLVAVSPARAQFNAAAGAQNAIDPPARVGRVARLSGTVSFHSADADHWEPATLNFPVTSGDAFWTQPGASADLDLGGARVRLDQSTEFTVDTLDDQHIAITAQQGHLAIDLRELPQGESATLRTPRGIVTFRQAGRYAVVVGDTQRPTIVSVNQGEVDIQAPGVALPVAAHQAVEINGTDPFTANQVAEAPDALISAFAALDRPSVSPSSLGPPPAVLQMTGYDAIAGTGSWEQAPDYGRVWYPPVDRDWVPYRQGRWSYVQPWGWTWVDDAPWGFAPSHYGRWVEIDNRWAWTPEDREAAYIGRPVYAPALVSFVGIGAGVALGVGIGAAVGWIPLGPREAYRPPYRVSEGYDRRVNAGAININRTTIINNNTTNVTTVNRFVNNRATTVVPAVAMQQSLPVAQRLVPQAQVQTAAFRPVPQPGVQPNLSTRGMTPAAAQALRLPAGSNAGTPLPAAPGPSFRQGGGRPGPDAGVGGARVPVNAPSASGAQILSAPGRPAAAAPVPVTPGAGAVGPGAPNAGVGARPGAVAPQLAPGPAIPPRIAGQAGAPSRPFEQAVPGQGRVPGAPVDRAPGLPGAASPPPGDRAPGRVSPGVQTPPMPTAGAAVQRPAPQPGLDARPQGPGAEPRPQGVLPGGAGAPLGFSGAPRPGPQPGPEIRPQGPGAPQIAPQSPRPVQQAPRAEPAFQTPRPQPQQQPQSQAPRPQPQPQAQAPRPQPAFQPPRPQPMAQPQPQPQPIPQAPRPQLQMAPPQPRPQPQMAPQPPRPQPPPQPAPQAPHPQPPPQAPRPQPQPQAAAPPAPHPQPTPHAAQGKTCPPGRLNC
eukprot:gene10805-10883_t